MTTLAEKIGQIRARQGEISDRITAIFKTADDDHGGEFTEALETEHNTLTAEYDENAAKIQSLESQAAARAAQENRVQSLAQSAGTAAPASQPAAENNHASAQQSAQSAYQAAQQAQTSVGGSSAPVDNNIRVVPQNDQRAMSFTRMCRVVAGSQGIREHAIQLANDWGYKDIATAMATTPVGDGGFVVPPNYVPELIELLRARTVIRQMQPTVAPLVSGRLTLPRQVGGATANYTGENTDIPESQLSGDQLAFTAKKLTALVPMSNELLRWSSPDADAMVRNDIVNAIAEKEDMQFTRGTASATEPTSLYELTPVGNKFNAAAGASPALAVVDQELNKLKLVLLNNFARMIRPAWLMSPRTYCFLEALRDGNGNKAYPEIANGMLKGYPLHWTQLIPDNLGVGTDESEIYFNDFADVVIAQDPRFEIMASNSAAYVSSGAVVSAFSKDQTVIRLITHHDFNARHVGSLAVMEAVQWGS